MQAHTLASIIVISIMVISFLLWMLLSFLLETFLDYPWHIIVTFPVMITLPPVALYIIGHCQPQSPKTSVQQDQQTLVAKLDIKV